MRVKNILKSDPRKTRDPAARLSLIEAMDASDADVQDMLMSIAEADEHEPIRLVAISKLNNLTALWSLYQADADEGPIRVAAERRIAEQLASADIAVESLTPLKSDKAPSAKLLLVNHCSLAAVREEILRQLDQEESLVEVVQKSRFHDTRQQAGQRLNSTNAMRAAMDACRDRDKVVAKQLQQRLEMQASEKAAIEQQKSTVEETLKMAAKLERSVWSPQTEPRLNALQSRWSSIATEFSAAKQPLFAEHIENIEKQIAEHVKQNLSESSNADELEQAESIGLEADIQSIENSNTLAEQTKGALNTESGSENEAVTVDKSLSENPIVAAMQEKLESVPLSAIPAWLEQQSKDIHADVKNLVAHCQSIAVLLDPPFEVGKARVGAIEERTKRIDVLLKTKELLPALNVDHFQYLVDLREHRRALDDRLGKARQESLDRIKATHRQFAALGGAIKDGKWGAANSMFKRLHKKVSAMESRERISLNDKLSRAEKQLDDMADWQDFASRPKLEAICVEMENLASVETKPPARAKKIKELQTQWKNLGVSRASNDLWSRFKTAGDIAYEPCKEFYEKKNLERQTKLDKKRDLCESLESKLSETDWENVDWKALQKTVNNAKRTWRDNRVTDRKPDKALEDRFTACISPMDTKLSEQFDANALLKKELVEKVTALNSGDISQHSINQTKSLQSAWKQVGIMRRKEDQELWEQFNEQCRAIFKVKQESDRESYKASMGHVFRARDIIKQLRKLSKASQSDDQVIQSLVTEFQELAEFPERDKRGLLKDFRSAVDACSRIQQNQQKKRVADEQNEQLRLVALCEQLENLVEINTPAADTIIDDVKNAWDGSDASVSRDFAKLVEARRDRALTHLTNGTQYDYEANEALRRDLLIRMEVAAGVDTPEEDKRRRMEFQLKHLQEGMTTSGDARAQLAELASQWLTAGPVVSSKRENLHSRYLKALGR